MQLQSGVTDSEEKKQKKVCMERYRKREDEEDYNRCSDVDIEREEECGICMEMNSKLVLPKCNHAMCSNCFNDWYAPILIIGCFFFFFILYYL